MLKLSMTGPATVKRTVGSFTQETTEELSIEFDLTTGAEVNAAYTMAASHLLDEFSEEKHAQDLWPDDVDHISPSSAGPHDDAWDITVKSIGIENFLDAACEVAEAAAEERNPASYKESAFTVLMFWERTGRTDSPSHVSPGKAAEVLVKHIATQNDCVDDLYDNDYEWDALFDSQREDAWAERDF